MAQAGGAMLLSTCNSLCFFAVFLVGFGQTVQGSPSAEVTFKEGENMTLPCDFPTSPANALYKVFWFKDGSKILTKGFRPPRITVHVVESRKHFRVAGQASLVVYNGDRHQHGVYSCLAWYMNKTINRKNVILFVEAYPIIDRSSPAVQNITQGKESRLEQLTLPCAVSAYPQARISWKKRSGGGLQTISGKEYYNGNNLTFRDPGKADSGTYTCTASNKMGTDIRNLTLTVYEVPKVFGEETFYASVGEDAKLKCAARGNPEPMFSWQWTVFNNSTKKMKEGENSGFFSVRTTHNPDFSESVLEIKKITEEDWGWYQCMAKSRLGTDRTRIRLTRKTKPWSPRIYEVKCKSDKALIKWEVGDDGGSPLTSLTIEYKEGLVGENAHLNWTQITITTPEIKEYTIENLKPHTFYRFRIVSTNEIGSSEPSNMYVQRTEESESSTALANGKDSGDFFSNHMTGLIVGVAGGFFALLIAILAIFCFVRKLQKNNSPANSPNSSRPTSHQEATEMTTFIPQQPVPPDNQQQTTVNPLCDGRWEFPRERLDLQTVLGSGAFGIVMKAQAAGIKGCVGSLTVAVKIVKDNDNETAKKDLLAELELLKLIEPHPNVIGLLGCCTRGSQETSLMLIVEYCHFGDLQSYLRHCRGIEDKCYVNMFHAPVQKMNSRDLLSFAIQVARGMAHLAGMKVVHRDLAARNVLIDEKKVIKISDFGFARDIYVEDHYTRKTQGGRFPIKWMALESLLDGVSTSRSDVWSFGVLLWEIVTLGASPYPGMNSQEVINFLRDGFRMDKPKHCSQELYVCMLDCWKAHPQHRPTFPDLARQLSKMLSDEQEYIDMQMYENHQYINFDKTTGTNPSANSQPSASTSM